MLIPIAPIRLILPNIYLIESGNRLCFFFSSNSFKDSFNSCNSSSSSRECYLYNLMNNFISSFHFTWNSKTKSKDSISSICTIRLFQRIKRICRIQFSISISISIFDPNIGSSFISQISNIGKPVSVTVTAIPTNSSAPRIS